MSITSEQIRDFIGTVKSALYQNDAVKWFISIPSVLYVYDNYNKDSSQSYSAKKNITLGKFECPSAFKTLFLQAAREVESERKRNAIAFAELTKNGEGVRIRKLDGQRYGDIVQDLDAIMDEMLGIYAEAISSTPDVVPGPIPTPVVVEKKERKVNKEKKMNDFSLENIKNAIVRKVTSLDKKTITLLSILALALLIVCRYKDIKDILNGIISKVKASDNFKEMVADGTNAVNGLKKIVGIKGE